MQQPDDLSAVTHVIDGVRDIDDATACAELVRNREVSPRELVDVAIARIERDNDELGAVIIPL